MPTSPTPLPTIPPFPALADKATGTYNSKAYDWATGWANNITPAIKALADNAYGNAVEAATSASTATTQATTATTQAGSASTSAAAAAASALTAVNAPGTSGTSTTSITVGAGTKTLTTQTGKAWVVGQPVTLARTSDPVATRMWGTISAYNSGSGSISIVVADADFAGTGTHTDWTIGLAGQEGPAGQDADLLMPWTARSGAFMLVQGDTGGASKLTSATVTFDTPAALGNGWTHVVEGTSGTSTLTASFADGSSSKPLTQGRTAYLACDGTAIRLAYFGSAISADQLFGTVGTAQVIASASSSNNIAICQLSSTRALVFYRNASGHPQVALVDQTGAKVAGHTPITLEAVSQNSINTQIIKIDATTAVVAWGSGGTAVKAVHLTVSGSTVTAGALCTVGAENGNSVSLALLTTTKFVATYVKSVTDSLCARTLTLSGTTLTANTEYTLQASLGGETYVRTAAVSSTQVQVAFCSASSNYVKGTLLTEASNVLTFPSVVYLSCHGASSSQIALPEVCAQTATRLIVAAGNTPENGGWGSTYLLDIGGSGSSATQQTGRQTVIAAGDGAEAHRMALLSANTFLHCSSSNTCPGIFVEALYTNGDGVRQGSAVSVARSTGRYDLCVLDATTALVAYVDSSNSNYPTVKPVALGTVV